MSKYTVPDDYWQEDDTDEPPAWQEDTSATIKFDVTLHNEGYQTDRKWTVLLTDHADRGGLTGVYGVEHVNKGNYWRRKDNNPENCVDFADLPLRVRQRVAHVVNRHLSEITPEHRVISDE